MDLKRHIYRRKRIEDSSKRNQIIRADKRERFLAYAYIRGKFILPEDHDPNKIMLRFDVDKNRKEDIAMLNLLDEVLWFKRNTSLCTDTCVVYQDGDGEAWKDIAGTFGKKNYMKRLYKISYLSRSKGIQYLYTPLTFFAWLTAESTKYSNGKIEIHVKSEDRQCIIDWLYYGGFEEVTGSGNYNIIATTDDNFPDTIFIDSENIGKMLMYITRDKYVRQYSILAVNCLNRKKAR